MNEFRDTETRFRRRLWQQWINPAGHSVPVFLVGCGRSGTSMLVRHLSRSWKTDLYNEDHPGAFQKWRLRELSVVEALLKRTNAPFVLFKPILDTYRTHVLISRFPDAKVIFAFRHFDDVINSSLKRFGISNRLNHVNSWITDDFREFSSAPPPEKTKELVRSKWTPSLTPQSGAALYWLFQNQLFFDLELCLDNRVKLVRYESVVGDSVNEFNKLCQFLGLDFEERIAEGVFSHSVGRDKPPEIDAHIRTDCDALWLRLCEHVSLGYE